MQRNHTPSEPNPERHDPILHPLASLFSPLRQVDERHRPFYELRAFRLYKRKPLELPPYLAASTNYFNPRWTGERRLKNVVVCVPNTE